MSQSTAPPPFSVAWIRDGVLVDRMHINPVAFAFAYWDSLSPESRSQANFTELVSFAFETSGVSAEQKMRMYNERRAPLLDRVPEAAAYYQTIASAAGAEADYFPGMLKLLRNLSRAGATHFITSAVPQANLDAWLESPQGREAAPLFTEVMGERPECKKGEGHFAAIRERSPGAPIYFVADAEAEIRMGRTLAERFGITPVGFAHAVTAERVEVAFDIVRKHRSPTAPEAIFEPARLHLPDGKTVATSLEAAGASIVVRGTRQEMSKELGDSLARAMPAALCADTGVANVRPKDRGRSP